MLFIALNIVVIVWMKFNSEVHAHTEHDGTGAGVEVVVVNTRGHAG
jgi:hypothetical protein